MFVAALFLRAKTRWQAKSSSTDEGIHNMWAHTKKYYSALNMEEIRARATTWMKLGDMMLKEISHEKTKTN